MLPPPGVAWLAELYTELVSSSKAAKGGTPLVKICDRRLRFSRSLADFPPLLMPPGVVVGGGGGLGGGRCCLAERESEDEVEAVEDEAAPEVAARLCRTAGTGLRLFLGAGTGDDPEVAASLADEDVGVVRREEVVEAGAV